ncbi:MAG: substrate-binding domain-containing protein, partial [Tenericutes bacterium]|nr:substrate-binding domain-containing protein [Mycoplasmatota bacterium]
DVQTDVSKRRIGFINHLKSKGIDNVINIEYPLQNYYVSPEQFNNLLDPHTNIDGIFCISDSVAYTVIKVLKSRGIRVPEDVKVIGYDGGRSFNNLGMKITSINQEPKLIADAIRKLLLDPDRFDKEIIIPVEITEGDTA